MQRRQLFKLGAAGLAGLCLRSLATGIPAALLAGPRTAWGQAGVMPQTLILCTSPAGDPFNAHAPGCDVEGASAPPDERLRRVNVALGETRVRAAQPWAALPRAMRDRMAFVLHSTSVNAHPEHAKVMRLLGAAKGPGGTGEDMLVSLIARHTAEPLGTIQREPVNMGKAAMTSQGRVLGRVTPSQLVDLFAGADAALDDLTPLRDQTLDALYADLKQTGTQAQRTFLDQYARSQSQARQLGQSLGGLLAGIPADAEDPDTAADQVRAAVAMASLRVAPAYVVTIPFGGDNHADPGLVDESDQTVAGIAALRLMWEELVRLGLQDEVTVCQWNVFGRTFETRGNAGRNHNGLAHTAMLLGPRVQPGVFGAFVRQGDDWAAQGIDPRTGRGVANGGITPAESLASLGKTVCAAVGLDTATIDADIRAGRVIQAVVAG